MHISELVDRYVVALQGATQLSVVKREVDALHSDDFGTPHLDARLWVKRPAGGNAEVVIEVLKAGYPRDVRMAVDRLHHYRATRSVNGYEATVILCVLAEYLSPGARTKLQDAGISYFDGTGSLYFKHDTYLVLLDREKKNHEPRRALKLFTGAREQVVHALLEHWRRKQGEDFISGAELANMAQTSPYTVSLTMKELERFDWVETKGKGPTQRRRLRNAAALLDAWTAAWKGRSDPVTRWYHFSSQFAPTDTVCSGLAGRQGWAITGAAAANAVVPHLTSVDRVQVIVPPGKSEAWAEDLKLKKADKGSNVVFIEREGAALMFGDKYHEQSGACFASRFVQYLDLLDGYGRNYELATEFRHQALGVDPAG